MKKEYSLLFIIGLFILAYVLDAVVEPLVRNLATPYHFLSPSYFSQFPFTTASVVIKAIGIFMTPLWLFGFFEGHHLGKGASLLVLSGLMQLYAVQEVATDAGLIPLEWAISFALAGIISLIPAILLLIRGIFSSMHQSLSEPEEDESENEKDEESGILSP